MEDPQILMQLISSMGFPIVACCALFYLINTTIKDLTSVITEVNVTMKAVLTHLTDKE